MAFRLAERRSRAIRCLSFLRPDMRRTIHAGDDGFQKLGESHPWAQGFSLKDKLWMEAMEFAVNGMAGYFSYH